MLDNKLTTVNNKASLKIAKGMNAVAQNQNIPTQVKTTFLTHVLLQPTPISAHLPRG